MIGDFEKKLDKAIGKAVLDMHAIMVKTLVSRLKKDRPHTGALARSIVVRKTSDGWEVGTNLYYAPYVEFGTGLYAGLNPPIKLDISFKRDWIRPKRRKFLRFEVARVVLVGRKKRPKKVSKVVFAKKVRGQEPKWYMAEAIKRAPELIVKRLKEEMR